MSISETISEEIELFKINIDAKILFPVRVWYKRNKTEMINKSLLAFSITILILLLIGMRNA
jgi:hypothetical protein